MLKLSKILAKLLLGLLVCASFAWSMLALHYDAGMANSVLPFLYGALCVGVFCFLRPFLRALAAYFVLFVLLLVWWLSIEPQMVRDWAPEYSRLPRAEIQGNAVTLHNLRNFEYRSETDFTPRWETRTYDLDRLSGFDLFFSYWGSPHIAHTIASWEFSDGSHLAISIETRREQGESYSAVAGFFRQFELYYVVSDERDLVGLRTNYRSEDVYLYRLLMPAEEARAFLLDYLKTINRLSREPEWYNALSQNCTTTIRQHVKNIAAHRPWNWRILANGHLDELGYMRGSINTSQPFEVIKQRSRINQRAVAAGITPRVFRENQGGPPGPAGKRLGAFADEEDPVGGAQVGQGARDPAVPIFVLGVDGHFVDDAEPDLA